MQPVLIYTTPTCGYCQMAKRLLVQKEVSFQEVDLFDFPDRRNEMISKAGGQRTVPQIFVGDIHIGGCDDLYALERANKLDGILAA